MGKSKSATKAVAAPTEIKATKPTKKGKREPDDDVDTKVSLKKQKKDVSAAVQKEKSVKVPKKVESSSSDSDSEEEEEAKKVPAKKTPAKAASSSDDSSDDSSSDDEPAPKKAVAATNGSVAKKAKDESSSEDESSPDDEPAPKKAVAATRKKDESSSEDESSSDEEVAATKKPAAGNLSFNIERSDLEKRSGGGEDMKKGEGFPRCWTEDDEMEIALLEGLIDYKKFTGFSPYDNSNVFYEWVKIHISFDVSKHQFRQKLRELKNKYDDNIAKAENGKEPTLSKPHDLKVFQLSKLIWGPNGFQSAVKYNGISIWEANGVDIESAMNPGR